MHVKYVYVCNSASVLLLARSRIIKNSFLFNNYIWVEEQFFFGIIFVYIFLYKGLLFLYVNLVLSILLFLLQW